jgi:hypothetical protein
MKIQMIHGIVFRIGKVNTPYAPGEIVEVTEAEAKQLIDEGSAVAVESEPTEKPKRTTKVV